MEMAFLCFNYTSSIRATWVSKIALTGFHGGVRRIYDTEVIRYLFLLDFECLRMREDYRLCELLLWQLISGACDKQNL